MREQWRHKETLHLTLKKKWFDIMASGEKKVEIREPSKWLMARLYKTTYDKIRFTNGYSKDAPAFEAEYFGYGTEVISQTFDFSIGSIKTKPTDIVIFFGKILKVENYEISTG